MWKKRQAYLFKSRNSKYKSFSYIFLYRKTVAKKEDPYPEMFLIVWMEIFFSYKLFPRMAP